MAPCMVWRAWHWRWARRITADTRAALEAADFEEARSAGRVLTLQEAVADALAIADVVVTEAKG